MLEQLPGQTEKWRVQVYRHPRVKLWTPDQGEAVSVEIFGHRTKPRRNQQVEWATELVSWVTPDMLAENSLTTAEYSSLLASIEAVLSSNLAIPVQSIPIHRVER